MVNRAEFLGREPLLDMDRETGEYIIGWPRCRMALKTILTTRLRTRIMRLWWGSEFLNAQDKPGNMEVMMASLGQAIWAINEYEPEFEITGVTLDEFGADGSITFTVNGIYLPDQTARSVQETF